MSFFSSAAQSRDFATRCFACRCRSFSSDLWCSECSRFVPSTRLTREDNRISGLPAWLAPGAGEMGCLQGAGPGDWESVMPVGGWECGMPVGGLGKWDACRGLGKWDACKGPVPEKRAVMCNTITPGSNATTDCVGSFIGCNMLQRSESNGKQVNAAICQ